MSENPIDLTNSKLQSAYTAAGFGNEGPNLQQLKIPEIKPIHLVFGALILGLLFKDRIIDFILGEK